LKELAALNRQRRLAGAVLDQVVASTQYAAVIYYSTQAGLHACVTILLRLWERHTVNEILTTCRQLIN
jgi:hypothetical protein